MAAIKETSAIMKKITTSDFLGINPKVRLKSVLNVFGIILMFVFSTVGCSVSKYFNEPRGFHSYPSDPRIYFETGAEANVKIIAESLNPMVEQIEKKQYRPFATKIKIYVFSNLANYEKHSPSKGSGGDTFGGSYIIISPKKANTLERLPGILAHELSHFNLFGYTGVIKAVFLPVWFKEGLAVWASNGGGAENVTEEEARQALLKGSKINPVDHESFWGGKRSHPKDMETHMFYRQSAMFIQYLYQNNQEHFKKLLYLIEEKGDLKYAFNSAYHRSLELLWSNFLKSIK